MRKILLVGIIAIISVAMVPQSALAWEDCPWGLVDDPYPGECARYIDTDEDGYCDHSQLAPEDREVSEESETETLSDGVVEAENTEKVELSEVSETQDEEVKPIKKLLPSIGMVIGFLASILLYIRYKKSKVKA